MSHALAMLFGAALGALLVIPSLRSWRARAAIAEEHAAELQVQYVAAQHNADLHATELDAIDRMLEAVYGVPLSDLLYPSRLDAIADLRRKGKPKTRGFDAPAAMLDALTEASVITTPHLEAAPDVAHDD